MTSLSMSVGSGHHNVDSDDISSISVIINNDVNLDDERICWEELLLLIMRMHILKTTLYQVMMMLTQYLIRRRLCYEK